MIDTEAVAAIGEERIDWRFKGLPLAAEGRTIRQAAELGLNLFEDGFLGPVLTIDEAALEHNITTMAKWCADRGVELAPHAKTTMAPQLWARQLAAGGWGLTAASAAQLRVYRAFGVSRVILANQVTDVPALRWIDRERAEDPTFWLASFVDSPQVVDQMEACLREGRAPSRRHRGTGPDCGPGRRALCRRGARGGKGGRGQPAAPARRGGRLRGRAGQRPVPAQPGGGQRLPGPDARADPAAA